MLFSDFRNCQHIFDKNGPMELDADEPRKFQGPPDRILGPADMGGGGGGGGGGRGLGEGKSEDSLWRRDLSALGPFGAEANFTPSEAYNNEQSDLGPWSLSVLNWPVSRSPYMLSLQLFAYYMLSAWSTRIMYVHASLNLMTVSYFP